MGGACGGYRGEYTHTHTHTILMKPERKKILARSRRRWENNIKINLQ
jgi:hypothetical protein